MSERGQASIEMLIAIPLLLVVALAIAQALAIGSAREAARSAAQAGALAVLQGGDPRQAARAAVPDLDDIEVSVRGAAVTVSVQPVALLPVGRSHLTARATFRGGTR